MSVLNLDLTRSDRCSVKGWSPNDGGIVVVKRQMGPAIVMVPRPMNRLPVLMVSMQIVYCSAVLCVTRLPIVMVPMQIVYHSVVLYVVSYGPPYCSGKIQMNQRLFFCQTEELVLTVTWMKGLFQYK